MILDYNIILIERLGEVETEVIYFEKIKNSLINNFEISSKIVDLLQLIDHRDNIYTNIDILNVHMSSLIPKN